MPIPPGPSRDAPSRVVIEDVGPVVECGRFPAKRVAGDVLRGWARLFADGHDRLAGVLLHRRAGDEEAGWREVPLVAGPNDLWIGSFTLDVLGRHLFTAEAWIDEFATWRDAFERRVAAGVDVEGELLEGARLVREVAARASEPERGTLLAQADALAATAPVAQRIPIALSEALAAIVARHPDRGRATRFGPPREVVVERERAAFGAWYELFPRSCAVEPGRHGTLADCAERLAYVAAMGFDVVYLPPIHPIGRAHRKGRNNATVGAAGDVGSPWAIGAAEGGHDTVHPALGTIDDFDRLVARAGELGLEIALDLAFQCSPDHPWVREHPGWFRHRADGSIRYAENPPKKYQDIYPLDFGCNDWRALWDALADVVRFWIGHGVRIFRVDNPHTKPFAFWAWLIGELRRDHPELVFLSEAFTRPAVMRHLAKLGFSQSYTYFTWRNTKAELTAYASELASPASLDHLRPNLFANTPDILPLFLQLGGRAGFQIRAALAATLAGSYGVYGPVYELCETRALPDREEYLDSEKFEVRHFALDVPESLAPYLTRLNEIRRGHPAFRNPEGLAFLDVDNEQLIAFARFAADGSDVMVVVVLLDPHHVQSGWLTLPLDRLGLDGRQPFQMDDLLGGGRYLWSGPRNFVSLDPNANPAHVFRVRLKTRTERDFDYFT